MDYTDILKAELADANGRLAQADKEGRKEVVRQIKEIERDIERCEEGQL